MAKLANIGIALLTPKVAITLIIVLFVSAATALSYFGGYFSRAELLAYDFQVKQLRINKPSSAQIKVVLVDEASLKSMSQIAGRWPWPRAIWSDLLDFMQMGGARAVLFDVLFLERQDQINDNALIASTRDFGNAYHSLMILKEDADSHSNSSGLLNAPLPKDLIDQFALHNIADASPQKGRNANNDYALPINGLASASKGIAVVEFSPDIDSSYRRTKPLREYQGNYFPVLGLAPFISSNTQVEASSESIQIEGKVIPIDEDGYCLINMYDLNRIETYSMSGIFASLQKIRQGEVENLLVDPSIFADSIVFIGASAIGTADLKHIPMHPSAPGVMLHAFFANNYLQNDFMSPPDRRITYLSIFLGVFLTAWAVTFSKQLRFRLLIPALLLCFYLGYTVLSFQANMQAEIIPFLTAIVSTSFLCFGYLSFTEGAEKRRVAQLFTQYVSKEVLNEVLNHYKDYLISSSGKKVEISVLFSDIRGFTTMSETTPPEEIVEMLNVHFTVMADIILKHNGTIDKYIGDAIMAFWGAPVETADHAERAVLAGQEMLEGLKEVNRILKERGFQHEIKIGIGINSGGATIGNIGSEQKKNYTIVGDTVNLAARLESITKEHHTPLLFSEYTYERIKGKIDCRRVGNVTVKGREQAVDIYTASSSS